jgi:hypothetical protein
VPHK